MKKTVLLATLILLTGTVSAVSQSELKDFQETYNNQTSEVPSVVGSIVGGETVNVEINRSNGTEKVGAKMEGLEMTEIEKGGFEDNTMNVYTDEETVQTILDSEDPFEQVKDELNSDDIEYDSTTTGGKVKLTVFDGLRSLAGIVGFSF